MNLLVVEDSLGFTLLLVEAQKRLNHLKLTLFKSGAEAISHLGSPDADLPSLILLDLNLPSENGIEILKTLKNSKHLKKIPVAILSTSTFGKDIEQSMLYKADGYFAKPFSFSELVNLLDYISKPSMDPALLEGVRKHVVYDFTFGRNAAFKASL